MKNYESMPNSSSATTKISQSYLDAMKALQSNCKEYRIKIQEFEDQERIFQRKIEEQETLLQQKSQELEFEYCRKIEALQKTHNLEIESLITKNEKVSLEYQEVLAAKNKRFKELRTSLQQEIEKKKTIYQQNLILEKSIASVEKQIEQLSSDKAKLIAEIHRSDDALQNVKIELATVVSKSGQVQEKLLGEIKKLETEKRELLNKCKQQDKEKSQILHRLQETVNENRLLHEEKEKLNEALISLETSSAEKQDKSNKELATLRQSVASLQEELSAQASKLSKIITAYSVSKESESGITTNLLMNLNTLKGRIPESAKPDLLDELERQVLILNKQKRENLSIFSLSITC